MFASGYAELYDLFNSDKPYKKEINFVYRWASKPRTVFDIGPGTGDYWKYYPAKTILFGVEKSRAMADKSCANGEIICQDIRNFTMDSRFDCATALFDVINYIPTHKWWKNIPVKKDGFFVFDIWNTKKIERDGFRDTFKKAGFLSRKISPVGQSEKHVDLRIDIVDFAARKKLVSEIHRMYLHTHDDILEFCGKNFEVVEVVSTTSWQTWYKCLRK